MKFNPLSKIGEYYTQCIEKILGLNQPTVKRWLKFPKIILTFTIVNFAWIFFRMPSIDDGFTVIRHIITDFGTPFIHPTTFFHLLLAIPIVFIVDVAYEFYPGLTAKVNGNAIVRWSVYLFLFVSIIAFGVLDSGQFIYVSF